MSVLSCLCLHSSTLCKALGVGVGQGSHPPDPCPGRVGRRSSGLARKGIASAHPSALPSGALVPGNTRPLAPRVPEAEH